MVHIRPVAVADKDSWLRHWHGYISFYEAEVSDDVTAETWRRLMDDDSPVLGWVAENDAGDVVGIVNCVLHIHTWMSPPACYLQDLFVDPSARGLGAGRALIEAVGAEAVKQGWGRVYWMTKANNTTARALYDKLADEGGWVRYQMPL